MPIFLNVVWFCVGQRHVYDVTAMADIGFNLTGRHIVNAGLGEIGGRQSLKVLTVAM